MIELPTVVVVVLGVLGVANLALTLALTARVREQSVLMSAAVNGLVNPEPVMLGSGEQVRPFAARTLAGEDITQESLVGPGLVAFVTPTCPACAESLPGFELRARALPSVDHVLSVVMAAPEEADELAARLSAFSRVVVEPLYGTVGTAFGVTGYPAFAVLEGREVVASHFGLDRLPEQPAA